MPYITFTTEDGKEFLVEVQNPTAQSEQHKSGEQAASLRHKEKLQELVNTTKTSFDSALDIVEDNAKAFIKKVRSIPEPPDEMQVTFGLVATGQVGAPFAIANAGLAAGYAITLIWRKEKDTSSEVVATNINIQPRTYPG